MTSLKPNQILYEDNHLLVVDKPAGIATMGADAGQITIARMAAAYLKRKYKKPGNVFVGVVSRLDQRVSGVLVLARTSKAASRLSQQIRDREPIKKYFAIVQGKCVQGKWMPSGCDDSGSELAASRGSWLRVVHHLAKNERRQRMEAVNADEAGSAKAELRVRLLAYDKQLSLVEIELVTGRKHQIRVQLAELGHPILGDKKYGASRGFPRGIALHCHQLTIMHPTRKEPMSFHSSPLSHWMNLPQTFRGVLA